ncbi:hypothetical protein SAMN05445504_3716 [Burkholderia sp. CF099]|nr:hypothetical protein SAMN05445504_3716 [Burkholderia sp. CF099]
MDHQTVVLDHMNPTLFLNYDGTLHRGCALLGPKGEIALDTGRALFEFAPMLARMLKPYPLVDIVLTTTWLGKLPVKEVIAYLPDELARRVVDTTCDTKARWRYLQNHARAEIIMRYAFGNRLRKWLALDDSAYGAWALGWQPGDFSEHFLLVDAARGLGDKFAQKRIQEWLIDVHRQSNSWAGVRHA